MSNCPPPSSRGMKMGVFRVKSQPEVMLTVMQLEFRFSVDFSFWRCLVLFSCIATFARSLVLKTVHAVVNCDHFATSVFKPVKVSMFKISTFISYHALFLEQQKNHYWLHWWCRQQWWQVCHSKQSILYGRFSIFFIMLTFLGRRSYHTCLSFVFCWWFPWLLSTGSGGLASTTFLDFEFRDFVLQKT